MKFIGHSVAALAICSDDLVDTIRSRSGSRFEGSNLGAQSWLLPLTMLESVFMGQVA